MKNTNPSEITIPMWRYLFGMSLFPLAIINKFSAGESYSGIEHIAIWHAPAQIRQYRDQLIIPG
jgi:hypothetical protein